MKKLYLASFVFETGGIEYNDKQLVLVTNDDLNDKEDHLLAAYNLAEGWIKQTSPGAVIKHLIVNNPIQSAGIGGRDHSAVKLSVLDPNEFKGPYSCKDEFPPLVPDLDDLSETVAIDVNGNMKDWDFGWYNFTSKEWCMQNRDFVRSFELEYAKWFAPPKPR